MDPGDRLSQHLFHFYYVTYQYGALFGSLVIYQEVSGTGLDLGGVQEILEQMHQGVCIISYWKRISWEAYMGYYSYSLEKLGEKPTATKGHLRLITGGNPETDQGDPAS